MAIEFLNGIKIPAGEINLKGITIERASGNGATGFDNDALGSYILSPTDGGWGAGAKPAGSHNGVGILSFQTHSGNYYTQLALSTNTNDLFIRSADASETFGDYNRLWNDSHFSTTDVTNWGTAYTHSQATHAPTDAEANVQADWNETTTTSDAFILNKPAIPTDFVSATSGGSFGGKLTISRESQHVTQNNISASNAHLDLFNTWESDTDQKGSIITFTDNYYSNSSYNKTLRAAIKGGTDNTGNTADGYLEFYTDSGGANTPNLVLRLDKSKTAEFKGNIVMAANATVDGVDISGLPTSFAPTDAEANVQADWNATTGDALILNKPTIPSGNSIIDWTTDQGSTNIHVNNVVGYINSSEPNEPFNPFAGQKFHDGVLTNALAGRHDRFVVTIDGTTEAGASLKLSNQNFEEYNQNRLFGTSAGETKIFNINVQSLATGSPNSNGITYSNGFFDINFYSNPFPASWSARVKNKDGNWTTVTSLNKIGNSKLRGVIPIGNWLTDIEFTLTARTSAPFVTGNVTYGISEFELFFSRMAASQGGNISSIGGYLGGVITTASGTTSANWNSAYGWGDHSLAGYLTSSSTQSKYIRSDVDDNFTGQLVNNSRNETPAYNKGAINLQPSTSGGSTGITFRSNVNSTSDAGYIWWYDNNDHYNELDSTENGVLLIAAQNDGGATSEDAIAIESSGDIYLNPGVASGAIGSGTFNSARGNIFLGNASSRVRILTTTDGDTYSTATGVADNAEVNVQADWNATSGDAHILNKPTIPPAHSGLYLPIGGGTITGNLQVNGQVTQAGVVDRVSWGKTYAASNTNIATLTTNDGNALPTGGAYRMTGHISGTGTEQVSMAVFWNENGTWYCNNTFAGGTSSNHIEFLISDSVPKVKTWHTNDYNINVSHERLSLEEGAGNDNLRGYFGADSYLQWLESTNALTVPGTLDLAGTLTVDTGLSGNNDANRQFTATKTSLGAVHAAGGEGGVTGSADTTPLITFPGNTAGQVQGGIYASQNSSTGTSISLFTTDSYSTGPKQGLSLYDDGNVEVHRGNIVMSSGATVDGVDISALPTTFAPTNAEQNVNANWTSTSGDSQILNNPGTPYLTGVTDRHVFPGLGASGAQARKHHIGRVYYCPKHWDTTWQNIYFTLNEETYNSGYVKYHLFGYYNGTNNQTLNLRVVDYRGNNGDIQRYKIVLGSHTDAGWDHSGQNVYYTDIYVEVAYYKSVKVVVDALGHSILHSNPTEGAGITVIYETPTITNITTYVNQTYDTTYLGSDTKIWNSANDGSGSGLDADTVDGTHGGILKRINGEFVLDVNDDYESRSGTWSTGTSEAWGQPNITGGYAHNDGTGSITFTVPTGAQSCWISHLTWSSGGYVDVLGVQSDGGEVFLRRINTHQSVQNSDEGASQHDGSTITFAGTSLSSFGKIKFKNRSGRFHLTGITFSSSQWEGTEGTGMIHPTQITKQGSGNGLDSDKLDGQQGTYYLDYNNFSNVPTTFAPSAHNQAWSTITSTPTTLAGYGITDIKPTYINHGVQGDHDMHTWDKVHAVYSDAGGSSTYWLITTNVPQDNYSMGGFELIFEDDYSTQKEGGTIKIYGYWNPESNGGFTGFKYTTDNPNLSSGLTIQVGRNTNGKTCFAISGHNQNYAQIIAKNLWLGYSASSADSTWGNSWSISTTTDPGLTNLNTLTKVPDARWDNIQGKPSFAPTDAEANVQADWNETTTTSDAFILNKPTIPTDHGDHDGLYLPIGGGTVTGDTTIEGDLIVGKDGTSKGIQVVYDDNHTSGAKWNTVIDIGKTEEREAGDGNYPTYVTDNGYSISFQSNSDGVLFGMEEYSTGNYKPVIAWGDDTSDSPFVFRYNNGVKASLTHDGTWYANLFDVGAKTGNWLKSDAMSDAIGWNASYGVYIGSNVGGTHYLRGNGTFTTGGNTHTLWHSGNLVQGSGGGVDADTVDGMHANKSYGVGKQYDFTVNGDDDIFYPVVISGASNARMTRITVFRGYNETAPSTWNTASHKGGLTLTYDIRVGGWGGYPNMLNVHDFGEIYSRICGGVYWTAHTMKHVIWLRGGGASYHIDCPNGSLTIEVNDSTSASNYVSSASNGTWYSYDHQTNDGYDVNVQARTLAQAQTGGEELIRRMPMRYNGSFNEATTLSITNTIDAATLDGIDSTGFATSSHNHDTRYLKLTGGTMNGDIVLDENRIEIFENAFIEGSGGQIDIGDIDGQDAVNGIAFHLMDKKVFSMNEDGAMLNGNLEFTHTSQTASADYGIFWTGWDKEGTTDNSDNAFIKHDTNQGGHTGSVLLISSMNDSNDGIAFSTHASSHLKHNGHALYSEGHKPTYTELGTMAYTNLTGAPTIPSGSQLVRVLNNQDYIASGGTSGDYRDNFGMGLTIYEGYNTGTDRPHTYDTTAQFMSTSSQGFELSIDWVSSSTTPLKIRSLRDCCQGWNPWTNVWTSHNFTLGSGGNLDADKVDGLHASSFIRSDANDTASGTYTFTGSAKFALDSNFANSEVRLPATTDQNPRIMFYRPTGAGAASYPWRFQAGGGGSSSSFYIGTGSNANNGSETIANKLSISSTGTLTVSGDVIAYGSPSDAKYKENVKPIENALGKVMDLEGVSFDWKENSEILDIKEDIGFIAQDVQKVIPELVKENEDGNLSLRYQGLIPVLLEAMKEQQKQIDELKSQMAVSNKRACNCKK